MPDYILDRVFNGNAVDKWESKARNFVSTTQSEHEVVCRRNVRAKVASRDHLKALLRRNVLAGACDKRIKAGFNRLAPQ